MTVLEGLLAFENLDENEMYQGHSTGKFYVVLTLDDETAGDLSAQGVKKREYEGVKQPKFSTKYDVHVLDAEGSPFKGRICRGSKLRVLYAEGQEHPVHGVSTYLNKIKVLEVAEDTGGEDF